MDENVPVSSKPTNNGRHSNLSGNTGHKSKIKLGKKNAVVVMAGIVLFVAFMVFGWLLSQSDSSLRIDGNKYQAVFLTNGQVYFGKLHKLNGGYFRLNDVFYLQTIDDKDSKSVQNAADSSSTNVQIIKLGNEIHGPDDEMIIDNDQILFFENLKNDGKVSSSIEKFKKQ